MRRLFLFMSMIILLLTNNTIAQIDISGDWNGSLKIPGMELKIVIHFQQGDSISGTMDIPQQMAKDLPLTEIQLKSEEGKNTLSFKLPDVPGNASFNGIVRFDGIIGDFNQMGRDFPLSVTKVNEEELAKIEQKKQEDIQYFQKLIDSIRQEMNVPGIGVGIIKDGEIVLNEGFGYKNAVSKEKVDKHTLFAIGSTTKAFTATLAAMLVHDDVLSWQEPIKEYIPEFKMQDNFAENNMTLEDLLCHRSGLPRHDLLWYGSNFTREELVEKIAYLEPTESFRQTFQYNNLMFVTAGYLMEKETGKTWEELLVERILDPLNMQNTFTQSEVIKTKENLSLPYKLKEDSAIEMNYRFIDQVGPAGTIHSCSDDMLKWLKFNLDLGKVDSKILLPADEMKTLYDPRIFMPSSPMSSTYKMGSYALGWMTMVYRDHFIIQHGGNIDGFSAQVLMVPDLDLGMVFLSNVNGTPIGNILSGYVMDRYLGVEDNNWYDLISKIVDEEEEEEEKEDKPKDKKGKKEVTLIRPIEEYVGEYSNEGYGTLLCELKEDHLIIKYNSFTFEGTHAYYDIFNGYLEELEWNAKFNFEDDDYGNIVAVKIFLQDGVEAIRFEKLPPALEEDEQYIEEICGNYELDGKILSLTIEEGTFYGEMEGQPKLELVVERKDWFSLKALSTFKIEILRDKKGEVTGLISHQPNGDFEGKRVKE